MDNVDLCLMNSFNKISLCERMWNVDAFHTQSLNFINGNDYDDDITSFTLSMSWSPIEMISSLLTQEIRFKPAVRK